MKRVAAFVFRLWLFWFKRAVWVAILSVILSSLKVALSQSGEDMPYFMEENDTNDTIYPVCPSNSSCESLPGHCLNCSFDYSCVYGELNEVSCVPYDTVECSVCKF